MKYGKYERRNEEDDRRHASAKSFFGSEKAGVKKDNAEKAILTYFHDLIYLLAGVMLVLLLCFRIVVVCGPSMNNTLIDGDYLLLLGNLFYQEPKQNDIIVASKETFRNGEPIIKRVIATEGQTVDIDFHAGIVYVDGVALQETYVITPTNLSEGMVFPLKVEPGCIFVMGDNRNNSRDSRDPEIGLIDKREIMGKVLFLFIPGTNGGNIPADFSRIGGIY